MNLTEIWTMPSGPERLARLTEHVLKNRASMETLTLIDYLTEIAHQAENLRYAAVDQARAEGATWQAIASQMGVSKQAAQKRYR